MAFSNPELPFLYPLPVANRIKTGKIPDNYQIN
jgi:hypothetical protein